MERAASNNRLIIDNVQPFQLPSSGEESPRMLSRKESRRRLSASVDNKSLKISNDSFMQRSVERKESSNRLSNRRARNVAEDVSKTVIPMIRQRSKYIMHDDGDEYSTSSCKEKSHPVDVDQLRRSIKEGRSHARGEFAFFIDDLPIKRDVNRNVDLEELVDLEYITEGSSSHIFSAVWQDQPVIVKMLQLDKADDAIAIHEFDIEAELLSRMDHPNIIKLLGSGISPRPFLILERLRDISKLLDLDREITPRKSMFHKERFTFPEVLQLAKDLADALNYIQTDIHPEAMIIHRDLKPENLGLAADGHLKLFDFGLCRCVQKRTSDYQAYEMTGNTGSLRYMAPEVVLNQQYTEKVDVYSFAIVVWAVASNRPPFKGFDRGMHRTRVVIDNERPKPDSDWPQEFISLLEACWNKDFTQRPTFAAISGRLDQIREAITKQSRIIRDGRSFLRRLSFSNRKT